jgi:hypothetical protein
MLGYIGYRSFNFYNNHANNYSKALFGIETPILVGIGGLILGVVLMFASWPFYADFFHRRWGEIADANLLAPDVDAAGAVDP